MTCGVYIRCRCFGEPHFADSVMSSSVFVTPAPLLSVLVVVIVPPSLRGGGGPVVVAASPSLFSKLPARRRQISFVYAFVIVVTPVISYAA